MRTVLRILAAVLTVLSLSTAAFAQGGQVVKIMLTIEGRDYPAILYDNPAAKDLLSRLPLTVSLNRGGRDYCGDIPTIKYDQAQVQKGYRNGQLAYWISGQDFVIFIEKEESGASVDGVVVLGELTGDYQTLFNLGRSITVAIVRAEK